MSLRHLRRVRWAVRACLALGVAASVAANVLHATPNPIAQAIAAWPPLALLLTVELISRVPVHRRSLAALRFVATGAIAGIAAWVSYWHMAAVAARYGESGAAPYLLPLSVDGLVVVASVSLVELAGRIRSASDEDHMGRRAPAPDATGPAGYGTARPGPAVAELVEVPAGELAARPAGALAARPAGALADVPAGGLANVPAGGLAARPTGALAAAGGPVAVKPIGTTLGERFPAGRQHQRTSAAGRGTRATSTARVPAPRPAPAAATDPAAAPTPRRGRPVEETRRLAAELAASQPDATQDDLARQLGITTNRLKRVLAAA